MRPSRRTFLTLGAAALALPRLARGDSGSGRKLIVVFCPGGWDPAMVFAPIFDDTVDHFPDEVAATIGGIPLVDSETRPAVRTFFETWGHLTAIVNGLQVPSVAHDVCVRWTLTGDAQARTDDWASIVAGHADPSLLMPNLHLSGPLFPVRYGPATVRVGLAGQLPGLLDGSALARSDQLVTAPASALDALEDRHVAARADAFAAAAGRGAPSRIAAAERTALSRAGALAPLVDLLDDAAADDLPSQLDVLAGALANGLSRTGVVGFGVGGNGAWDTHSASELQGPMYQTLFAALDGLVTTLATTPGQTEPTLLDETVIVVLSEMGRTPLLTASGGKDHWTFTSALLVGGPVRGGQAVGGWGPSLIGSPVDLASGAASSSGVVLGPAHLGATLLALMDLDPAEFVDPAVGAPIAAVVG